MGISFLCYMMKGSSLFSMTMKILGVFTGPVAALFLMGLASRGLKIKVNITTSIQPPNITKILGVLTGTVAALFVIGLAFRLKIKFNITTSIRPPNITKLLGVFTGPVAALFPLGLAFRLLKIKVNITA